MSGYILRRNDWGETSAKWVLEGIKACGVEDVTIVNKDQTPVPEADWCIRWATTSDIPGKPKVINKAQAIHRVYNKGFFRKTLADAGLAPKTVIDEYPSEDMYPVVLRPMNHCRSDDLYIAYNLPSLKESLKEIEGSFYCSAFIDKDKEFRVFIVSGRVVAVCEKVPSEENIDDVSWGCVGNGMFNYVKWSKWPIDVIKKACLAFKLSGLDFGAADVILEDQVAYVLEINTGPDLSEYFGYQVGIGLAHIIETGERLFIEPGSKPNNPYSYAHPRMTNNAIME